LPIATRDIDRSELKGGGYLATPDPPGPHPAVVVIHEAYGLTGNIKDIARRFANAGYAALAVDLFTDRNRAVCMTRYMAGMLLGSVNRYGINDLKAALTYLAKSRDVDARRMGAIGFCMGGGFAIAWACTDSRVKRLCPVVGSYPGKDFTANAGLKLDEALERSGITRDIKIYPGAQHSFFNDTTKAFDKTAAEDSWARVMKFFGEELGEEKSRA
jgi:carboxymethylenebutenolidase